jgi:hypothetical protein
MYFTKTLSIAPALILAVSLTACSDLLTVLDQTSLPVAAAEEPKAASPVAAKSEVTHPDLPASLIACATATNLKAPSKIVDASKEKPSAAKSADAKVVALQQQSEARRSCAIAIIGWYRKLQEATKKAQTAQTAAAPKG